MTAESMGQKDKCFQTLDTTDKWTTMHMAKVLAEPWKYLCKCGIVDEVQAFPHLNEENLPP